MGLTRRQLLSGAAAASVAAAQDSQPGQFRRQNGPKPRSIPPICLFSDQIAKIGYDDLGGILKMLGFDGCDLSVQPGGHIPPEHADLDFMRAVEAMNGSGVDVYMISTTFTSPQDQTLRLAMQWGGEMGVPFFRPGHWKYTAGDDVEARMVEAQRDIAGLAAIARATGISVGIHNATPDYVGGAMWDTNMIIRGMEARLVGYDFDTGYAVAQGGAAGFNTLLHMAQPRLKMVTARDCYWNKEGSEWKLVECPLGEGMVDWTQFFAALVKMRFTGPISLQLGYPVKDELPAIRKDLAFLKKQVAAAYGG